jgi:hypothetical protein
MTISPAKANPQLWPLIPPARDSPGRNSISEHSFPRFAEDGRKSALPNWSRCFDSPDCSSEMLLQHSDPVPQPEVIWPTHKKMQMIGHDDVTTDCNIVFRLRSDCEFYEGRIYRICRYDVSALMGTERDKKQRVVGEDASESWRNLWMINHAHLPALSLRL